MKRLDVIINEKRITKSRERAKEMILAGKVFINGTVINKPGKIFNEEISIDVRTTSEKEYVSRGGLKLEKALKAFNIDIRGFIAMDVGASTGGFTDCMLKNGCNKVYAIDVGKGQLSDKLRNDMRVKNLEGINIRYIDNNLIDLPVNFFSVDVSFISLCLVLPKIYDIIENSVCGVCLIKPQFEAGRDKVGKKGVVKDNKTRVKVIDKICKLCVDLGFNVLGLDYSPIKGPEGNIEYLLYIQKSDISYVNKSIDVEEVVKRAYKQLECGER